MEIAKIPAAYIMQNSRRNLRDRDKKRFTVLHIPVHISCTYIYLFPSGKTKVQLNRRLLTRHGYDSELNHELTQNQMFFRLSRELIWINIWGSTWVASWFWINSLEIRLSNQSIWINTWKSAWVVIWFWVNSQKATWVMSWIDSTLRDIVWVMNWFKSFSRDDI